MAVFVRSHKREVSRIGRKNVEIQLFEIDTCVIYMYIVEYEHVHKHTHIIIIIS